MKNKRNSAKRTEFPPLTSSSVLNCDVNRCPLKIKNYGNSGFVFDDTGCRREKKNRNFMKNMTYATYGRILIKIISLQKIGSISPAPKSTMRVEVMRLNCTPFVLTEL